MTRTLHRLGRRGAMLLVLGVTYIALGYGVGTRPMTPAEGAFVLYLPTAVLAVMWAGSGAVAVLAAWRRWDSAGWLALYVVPVLYVLSYGGAWAMWMLTEFVLPAPTYGDPLAWYNAALRVPFIAIVLICSGWRETTHARTDR